MRSMSAGAMPWGLSSKVNRSQLRSNASASVRNWLSDAPAARMMPYGVEDDGGGVVGEQQCAHASPASLEGQL